MKDHSEKNKVCVLGIDLAKSTFQLHGVNAKGEQVLQKKLTRKQLASFIARLPTCLIGIEACGGAHFWVRKFESLGHRVKIMAPQFVKPYVKSNKNDAVDAEAICEAVQRPNMRFVAAKSIEQQDMQALHRIRSHLVSRRTAQANQIRGLLLEYGITVSKGIHHVRKQIPLILEDADNELSDLFRGLLNELNQEFIHLNERIATVEKKLLSLSLQNKDCQRLLTIPGIGLLSATALVAAIGDVSVFKNGRELSAWLGLVPKQHSTGGKEKLLGISKRGDSYLRTLLIHGGRSVVQHANKYQDRRSQWICHIEQRRGRNVCAVAVANKNARTIWALLSKQVNFDQQQPVAA